MKTASPSSTSVRRPAHRESVQAATPPRPRRVAINSILVPTDFSPAAEKAIDYACGIAAQFNAKIVLLHAIEPICTPDFYPPIADEQARTRALERLKAQAAELRKANVAAAAPHVVTAIAWDAIVRTADSLEVDLIVIATHGYTGFKHMVLGSTAERVTRHARCPVLVVRERERDFVRRTTAESHAKEGYAITPT